MTQLDPHLPSGAPVPPDDNRPGSPRPEPGFNWRVTVGMLVGLVVLFGVLFGLRALQIFPAEPGQDAVIAAARATQAALGTQEALAPRPTLGIAGASAGVPTAAPTLAPPNTAVQPTSAPTPALQQQPATAPQSAPTTLPPPLTQAPTGAPTVQSNPTTVQAEATPVQATVPADLAAAIVQGYSDYWTVRVKALREPDPTNPDLDTVMAGTELSRAEQLLSGYQQQGTAYRSDVKHQIWITQAGPNTATIVDRYVATSIRVDPTSLEPVNPVAEPNVENLATTFLLQSIGGTWKVIDQRGGG